MSSIGSSTSSGLDSLLMSYYQAQLASSPAVVAANSASSSSTSSTSATAKDNPPWNTPTSITAAQTAKVLSTTDFLNTSNVPLTAGATTDSKTEQDNQKLFSLYSAVNSLSYLAQLAQSSTETAGQIAGLNTRFQEGLTQVENYVSSTSFNSFALEAATPAANVTSTASVSLGTENYTTQQLLTQSNINNPVPGLSTSDSFNIAVSKNGTSTNVPIDLSQVSGPLTLGNIVSYINTQLSAGGFSTRFQKTETGETTTSDTAATYGLQIMPGGNETVSLSAASTPALYMVGDSGSATEVDTTDGTGSSATVTATPADQTGRLTKIGDLSTTPTAIQSSNQSASTGTTTAAATVVDSSGNVYVVGNATGNLGNEINQGTQDVYLTKYDSAGNAVWQSLVGSAGSASGYSLALDPAGGVVVAGSTTADLNTSAVADGNTDSFVASYDANGNQTWTQQIPTLATNQANAVSVSASGNIYIGGSVSGGVIGSGQTAQGSGDAYLAELNSKGTIVAENQFGTSGSDQVSATAIGSDGSLYVASVQNGAAIVSKYANGDITSAPVWSENLGALQSGGAIGGLTVSGNQVYVSGSTSNANLTAGGQATVAAASSGGTDAFVMGITDNGSTATASQISYIGTSATDQGGAVTVGPDGTIYLTGTTTGTFAGQTRNVQGATNAFVTAINPGGSVQWTRQYGGASGQSTGAGIAIDPTGASVLDSLGLPQGTINPNQSVELAEQTTLRTGDSFQIGVEGVGARTSTITIGAGETLDSLVIKINGQLGSTGKASINYTATGESLKITANAGQTLDLIAGPTDSDALSRLGIAAGVLSAPATSSKTSTSTSSSSTTTTPTYGLGLTGGISGSTMNIASKTGADLARSQLLTVMSNIQAAYQKSNTPAASTATNPGNTTGTASASTTAQLANYSLALSLLGASSSNASNNIAIIVAGGTVSSTGTTTSSASSNPEASLLGLF
jgi:hypothetical protein